MKRRRVSLVGAACAVLVGGAALGILAKAGFLSPRKDTPVDFNRDIRPIFNQNCVACHGGVRQINGVSFIYREEALGRGKSGRPTIVPGKPNASELMARLTTTDPEARMPYRAAPLSEEQIALLRRWIKEGAQWEDHWAFVPPKRQALPRVKNGAWVREPLDRFILARLEGENLNPSPQATRSALLRRVSLDLTGMPPTVEELSTFLTDTSPDAYEKQVDRLLASPHYGERWASLWLDLARYADSKGYQKDFNRSVWPYRDWVIDAFNRNLPYDRFVVTQLAGDLLPNATLEDRIATSLQRQTPANDEAGTDDEEFRLVAVMDRVATTWSVLNGVTINCVQCHSHPYDPIRHTEYYKFLAFYNTSRDRDLQDDSPVLRVPKDRSRNAEVFQLQEEISALHEEVVDSGRRFAEHQPWQPLRIVSATADEVSGLERRVARLKEEARHPLQSPLAAQLFPEDVLKALYDSMVEQASAQLARAKAKLTPAALDLRHGEAWANASTPEISVYELIVAPGAGPVTALRIEVPPLDAAKARHSPEQGFIVDRIDAWVVQPGGPERKIEFSLFAPDSTDIPETLRPGTGFGADSKLFQTRWTVGILTAPLRLGPRDRIKVQLAQTQTFIQEEKPAPVRRVRLSASSDARWTAFSHDPQLTQTIDRITRLDSELAAIESVPLPIMEEQDAHEQRETLEFERGNPLTQVGAALIPDVPKVFPKLPANAPRNRLTMARWFFEPKQPLTARVAVNRYWEQLFGTGIVETLEDFGSAGEDPSHPELLDWLALHFENDLHWDMKALLRELVTSATYRQSAATSASLLRKDPRNRLLARGPQQRLTAEMVHDQALVAAGLLNDALHGPPVVPPEPRFVERKKGPRPDRYRRAIYTELKRGAIDPSFLTFDAAAHDVSLARRIPTNTPLQALVTLNEPLYQEAAHALAQQMLNANTRLMTRSEGASSALRACLNVGSRRVLSRDLSPAELTALENLYADVQDPKWKLANVTWNSKAQGQTPAQDMKLAALTAVASVLLNLDAALTR